MSKQFLLILGVVFSLLAGPSLASVSTGTVAHPTEIKGFNNLKPYIFEAERKTGVSAELLTALLSIETTMGTDTRNPYSNVKGVMQHTNKTWRANIKKFHKQLGLSANASVHNARASILVAAAALADNKVYLQKRTGKSISNGDLYISHLVGLGGAERILKGKSTSSISKYIALRNGNGKHYHVKGKIATVAQFRAKMNGLVKQETRKYITALDQSRLDNLMVALNDHDKVTASL